MSNINNNNMTQNYLKINTDYCKNFTTRKGCYANPCGNWENTKEHINSGTHVRNVSLIGSLFPTNYGNHVMVPPTDRVVYPYTRIGNENISR